MSIDAPLLMYEEIERRQSELFTKICTHITPLTFMMMNGSVEVNGSQTADLDGLYCIKIDGHDNDILTIFISLLLFSVPGKF